MNNKYLTLYEIYKQTGCNRSSLKSIINYLGISYVEVLDSHNKIKKKYIQQMTLNE